MIETARQANKRSRARIKTLRLAMPTHAAGSEAIIHGRAFGLGKTKSLYRCATALEFNQTFPDHFSYATTTQPHKY
jgi:hypothetical protein